MLSEKPFNKEEWIWKLQMNLPWSLSVISLLVGNEYMDVFVDNEICCISILNKFHEWIVFSEYNNRLEDVIQYIRGTDKRCRIVSYSKNKFDINSMLFLRNIHYHIEDFMIASGNMMNVSSSVYRLAGKGDIPELAKLHYEYCIEEISWSYYHKDLNDLKKEYIKKIDTSSVFIAGDPVVSKVEIVSRFLNYIKLGSIYTKKDSRHKGFARLCLEGALNWCAENKLTPSLNVRQENVPAKNLYSKNGFSNEGEVLYCVL